MILETYIGTSGGICTIEVNNAGGLGAIILPKNLTLIELFEQLGNINRYNGATPHGFSVLQHTYVGLQWLQQHANSSAWQQHCWTMHDLPETLIQDTVPMLRAKFLDMTLYSKVEKRFISFCCRKFNLQVPDINSREVKLLDGLVASAEKDFLGLADYSTAPPELIRLCSASGKYTIPQLAQACMAILERR